MMSPALPGCRVSLSDFWLLSKNDFDSWQELYDRIVKDHDPVAISLVYLYDHSGQVLSMESFQGKLPQGHAEFDSMKVGFIFVSRAKCIEEWDDDSKESIEKAASCMKAEFDEFNLYVQGQVYGFVLEKKIACKECGDVKYEELDSCWGFYGNDFDTNGMKDHVQDEAGELLDKLA